MKSVVVDLGDYDWEGDAPLGRSFADTVIYEAHVRGFTAHPNSGVDAGAARHVRRVHRADPVPRQPRRHRGRAAAGLRVRRPGRARRPAELLGLPAGLLLRAPRRVQQPARRAGRGRRVPRSRQGPPPGRPRGHPRRRLQPHRRGRPGRPDVLLPRPGERGVLHRGQRRPLPLRRLQRHRQHPQRQRAGRPAAHPRQPPLLGRGDARGRVPLRSRVGPVARRGRPTGPAAARHLGHRDRSDPGRHEADRRSVGRGRPVPGRLVRGRSLGRVERPLPRRRAVVRQGRSRQGLGHRGTPAGEPRHLRPARPRAREDDQLRHLPRRVHAQRRSSRTTRSTTRRTAKATATATTRT